jgi:hypothetical protein
MGNLQEVTTTLETMSVEDFINLPEIHCQRDTDLRVKRAAKLLTNNPQITQMEVKIAQYPDGARVVLDGNTRAACWRDGLAPKNFPMLAATVYHVPTKRVAQNIYESVDSTDAVESTTNKMQGALKAVYGKGSIVSQKIKVGRFTRALQHCVQFLHDEEAGRRVKFSRDLASLERYLRYYYDEILFVDRMLDHYNLTQSVSQSEIALALMMLKKYGTDNKRCVRGIMRMFTKDMVVEDQHPNQKNRIDGVSWINTRLQGVGFMGQILTKTDAESMDRVLNYYIAAFEKYMDGKLFSSLQHKEKTYQHFFKNNNFSNLK